MRQPSGRNNANRHRVNGTFLDRILVYCMGIMLLFYILVSIRTFQHLPALPKMGHIPHTQNDIVYSPMHIEDLGKRSLFPISIDPTNFETIPHPATEVSSKVSDEISNLIVPPMWDPIEFQSYGGVRKYLGDYGRHLMTPKQAQTIGSYVTIPSEDGNGFIDLETIFVAIASYRDFQCRQTIESAFSRAKYPERLRIAVVDQYVHNFEQNNPSYSEPICSKTDHPCSSHPQQILCKYKSQIDFYPMEAKYAVGPVFARHLGQRMYRGEYFAVQSDAHVDFILDWDVSIISQWKSAENEMAVLTAYLSDVNNHIDIETGHVLSNNRPIMCQSDYEGHGKKEHLRHGQQPEGAALINGEPTLEPFWAAGFSFGRGHFVVNVPYDQHLPMIFMGEEISIGVRGFTYGYDYYTAENAVCFHYYAKRDVTGKRKSVKKFFENRSLYRGVEENAMMRLNGIVGMNPEIDPSQWIHDEEELYGLGKVRTTQKFFDSFGIDTAKKKVQKHLCQFVGKNMHNIWKQHLRKNRMGIDYDAIEYKFQDPEEVGRTWEKYLKKNDT